jgi:putative cardiolipin synthase
MIIADGETIITGGRNVGDKYFGVNKKRNFSDLDLMAKGKVAAAARENFFKTWNSKIVKEVNLGQYELVRLHDAACTIVLLDINQERCPDLNKRILRNLEKEKQRILDILKEIQTKQSDDLVTSQSGNDWFRESYNIQNVKFHSHEPAKLVSKETAVFNEDLLRTIGSAKSDVNIVSPYLIPTDNLIKVFTKILSRNVRIRIITNSLSSTDNLLAQTGYRKMKQKMIDMGIELYEYNGPDTIHAKTAVVDNRIVLIGTYNIDPRSAFLNREIGVIADDKENKGLAAELTKIIDGFRKNSTLIGKDKQLLHKEDLSKLPRSKMIMLKSIEVILPLIRNQL